MGNRNGIGINQELKSQLRPAKLIRDKKQLGLSRSCEPNVQRAVWQKRRKVFY